MWARVRLRVQPGPGIKSKVKLYQAFIVLAKRCRGCWCGCCPQWRRLPNGLAGRCCAWLKGASRSGNLGGYICRSGRSGLTPSFTSRLSRRRSEPATTALSDKGAASHPDHRTPDLLRVNSFNVFNKLSIMPGLFPPTPLNLNWADPLADTKAAARPIRRSAAELRTVWEYRCADPKLGQSCRFTRG
jgi:hypothetical protein